MYEARERPEALLWLGSPEAWNVLKKSLQYTPPAEMGRMEMAHKGSCNSCSSLANPYSSVFSPFLKRLLLFLFPCALDTRIYIQSQIYAGNSSDEKVPGESQRVTWGTDRKQP